MQYWGITLKHAGKLLCVTESRKKLVVGNFGTNLKSSTLTHTSNLPSQIEVNDKLGDCSACL